MNKIKELMEQEMYKYYLKEYPKMVEGISVLLTAGEKPSKIKRWCESVVGKSMTSYCVSCMIDHVNKQVKN